MGRISSRKLGALAMCLGALGSLSATACSADDGSGYASESVGSAQQALNSTSYVSGKQWMVDGQPWLMKGVNWDPSEPCEWYTQYNWGRAAGDAAILQANGFNTIRTYGFTSAKTGLPESGYITTAQLDEFKNRGIRVILTVHSAPGDATWTGTTYTGSNVNPATGDYTAAAKTRIQLLAAHPAVIALGVGNEIDWNYFYTKDPGGAWSNGWSLQNVVAHANYVTTKTRALTDKPVTVSWGNTAHISEVANLNADIVSYQIYHQLQLDNVFNLHANVSGKPFYISEFGADAWNQNINGVDQNSQKIGNNTLFKMILDQATTGAGGNVNHKVVGGTVFSFSDGWWKGAGGNACNQESGGIAPGDGPYPDLTFNEEYWGLCTGDGAATRTCRSTMTDLKNLFATYGTTPPPPLSGQIEAENYTSMSGVGKETCSEGGQNVMDIGNGEWIGFNNVALSGVTSFQVRVAGQTYAGTIEFRTGSATGTLLATCNAPITGGWQNWQTITCTATGASGNQNLFLVSKGTPSGSQLPNINWFKPVVGGTCTPTTCSAQGKNCGSISDGCGGTLTCGSCSSPQSCGGSGTANVCGCTATTCAAQGKNCGTISNGCGGTLSCGTCGSGQSCSASNVCQASCTPTTCAAQGKNCGSISDGCGGTLSCGTCSAGNTCSAANTCQASGGACAPTVTSYSAGKCNATAVYNGKMYKCISQASGVNGSTACGTAGVYCSTITPTDAAWGATAWQFVQNCP